MTLLRSETDWTGIAATDVITSPGAIPAAAAPSPAVTSSTAAPATLDLSSTLTPRIPRWPDSMYGDAVPARICWAMLIARVMGIAHPHRAPAPVAVVTEPAVSMPITRPSALSSGPPESPGWIGASKQMTPSSVSLMVANSSCT